MAIPATARSMLNPGAHGLSEVLYAFTSASNNNGSAFAGLGANTDFYNMALGVAMPLGRFLPIFFVLALAGSFAQQGSTPPNAGTLPTHRPQFVRLLTGVVVIVAGLTFVPALALGPLAEGLMMTATPPPEPLAHRVSTGASTPEPARFGPRRVRKLDPRACGTRRSCSSSRSARSSPRLAITRPDVVRAGGSRCGCGSRSSSPTWPRPWPRGAARRRPRLCAQTRTRHHGPDGCAGDVAAGREVPATDLRGGRPVVFEAGDVIPGDGDVVEGVASVDESAITGESAPVIRESGGDRSAVTGGTMCSSDRIVVQITADPGKTFIDRMIALVEGASRQKTPNEIALNILLASADDHLPARGRYPAAAGDRTPAPQQPLIVLVALLVCLIPTTIGALLSAIGIAGMDRLVQRNVLAMSGRAVEAAGDVNTLLLDKTGTITLGNRQASDLVPVGAPTRGAGRRRPAVVAGRRDSRGPLDRRAR